MISPQARTSFDTLVTQAVAENLVAQPGERCEVTPIQGPEEIREQAFVILTISSYLFRTLVLFHFSRGEATEAHFARVLKTSQQTLDERTFFDAVAEFGNLCCGALNRELGRYFPHVGMSTPNILEHDCIDHLETLQAGYQRHFRVEVEGGGVFHATLLVCDYGDLDFHAERRVVEEASGELELF